MLRSVARPADPKGQNEGSPSLCPPAAVSWPGGFQRGGQHLVGFLQGASPFLTSCLPPPVPLPRTTPAWPSSPWRSPSRWTSAWPSRSCRAWPWGSGGCTPSCTRGSSTASCCGAWAAVPGRGQVRTPGTLEAGVGGPWATQQQLPWPSVPLSCQLALLFQGQGAGALGFSGARWGSGGQVIQTGQRGAGGLLCPTYLGQSAGAWVLTANQLLNPLPDWASFAAAQTNAWGGGSGLSPLLPLCFTGPWGLSSPSC